MKAISGMERRRKAVELSRRVLIACPPAAAFVAVSARCAMAEPQAPGYARDIAGAISKLPAAAPSGIAERTAWTLLDAIGAMVYASTLPDAIAAARYFTGEGRRGDAIIPATAFSASAPQAAAATAYLIHAAEIDDSDLRGQLRASSVIMAASLAAAQAADADGAAFVRAAALGYTLQGRFASPVGPVQSRGWMASGVWGPPAAAAAAALLYNQNTNEIAAAITLAAGQSGGLFQYYFDQTDEKRLIVARAARAAIESADLARLGEEGASHIIEGKAGLYRLFGGVEAPPARHFIDNLGALEGPLFVRPKFYAASHSIIPTLDGLAAAAPDGIDPDAVKNIIVRGDPAWGAVIGDKINAFEAPTTRIGAALNFSFVVALWILRGRVLPGDYSQAGLRDPAIIALAHKTVFENAPGEHLSIEVVTANGATIRAEAIDPALDAPAPLNEDRRLAKFAGLAGSRLTPPKVSALRTHCLAVGNTSSMREWVRDARAICN